MALSPLRARQQQQWEKAGQKAEQTFSQAHKAHASYAQNLRQLSRQVARIVSHYAPTDSTQPWSPSALARLDQALRLYGKALDPWARATAARMMAEVNRRNRTAWMRHTEGMASALRKEVAQTTLVGAAWEALLGYQAQLITSLPLEASQRIHEKTVEAINHAGRYPEQEAEIAALLKETHPLATQQWLANRATLIARTETARTASALTEVRAKSVGSSHYEWLTAGDARVRMSHRPLNRTIQEWDNPPLSDPPNHRSHPGQMWNCRCTALPILL